MDAQRCERERGGGEGEKETHVRVVKLVCLR